MGDSAGYIIRNGTIINRTIPHTPTDEKDRIEDAGGEVKNNKIDNKLDSSRAFGDYRFKKSEPFIVSNVPHIINVGPLKRGDTIILCSDGVTNVLSPEEILDIERKEAAASFGSVRIIKEAEKKGINQNASALVIRVS